jgi:hypothetical protein
MAQTCPQRTQRLPAQKRVEPAASSITVMATTTTRPRPFAKLDVEQTLSNLTIDEAVLLMSGRDMVRPLLNNLRIFLCGNTDVHSRQWHSAPLPRLGIPALR